MDSKLGLYLRRLIKSMWFRASAFSALAVVAALVSIFGERYVPPGLSTSIGADALDHILGILASTMLTVTTFSLGIAVSAYNSAASAATPRATNLLIEDTTTQNVLSTFVGAFLFSLVGIIVLQTGAYGEQGRIGLYLMTIVVIIVVVGSLLRWIGHLTTLGRIGDTLHRVETAARDAMDVRLARPYLGCEPLPDGYRLPRGNHPVYATAIGYVQHIDVETLHELAATWKMQIAISALPGTFTDPAREVLVTEAPLNEEQKIQVCHCFVIGQNRTFEQDPRFGIIVLSEISARALSPAVNDPGTAIDVIGRLVRLLHHWTSHTTNEEGVEVVYPGVFAPGLKMSDLFDDAFTSIARDAAGIVEVNIRLQKALATLAASDRAEVREEALRHSVLSLERAQDGLRLPDDVRVLKSVRDDLIKNGDNRPE